MTYLVLLANSTKVIVKMHIVDIPEFKDKKKIMTLDEGTKLFEAAAQMKKHNYGAAAVTDKTGKLVGIISERDFLMKVVAEKKDISKLKVSDVMTKDVKTAKITDTVHDSMRRMTQGRFRHLPIIDEEGKLTGMVSQGDFVAISWMQLFEQFKNRTKTSFLTHTQIWTIIISLLVYLTVMLVVFK